MRLAAQRVNLPPLCHFPSNPLHFNPKEPP
jgi:hypothetical protein